MKTILFTFLLFVFNCETQTQTSASYDIEVYRLINAIFKSKNNHSQNTLIPINIYHDLNQSSKNIEDELLSRLLNTANKEIAISLPASILEAKNWKSTNTDFKSDRFDQNKVIVKNVVFCDPLDCNLVKKNDKTNLIYTINAILFLDNYAIIKTTHMSSFITVYLYKRVGDDFQRQAMITDPPLGYE